MGEVEDFAGEEELSFDELECSTCGDVNIGAGEVEFAFELRLESSPFEIGFARNVEVKI